MTHHDHVHTMQFQQLDIYTSARDLAVQIHRLGVGDAELRDQLRRASKSAFLNIAEGLPAARSALKQRYFATAIGSLCEVQAALDLCGALGLASEVEVVRLQRLTVRITQMTRAMKR